METPIDLRKAVLQRAPFVRTRSDAYGVGFCLLTFALLVASEALLGLGVAAGAPWFVLGLLTVLVGRSFYNLQFVLHEACHGMVSASRSRNELCGKIGGYLAGMPFEVYRRGHSFHHRRNGTAEDPEFGNFFHCDDAGSAPRRFTQRIAKSLFCLDALQFLYQLLLILAGFGKTSSGRRLPIAFKLTPGEAALHAAGASAHFGLLLLVARERFFLAAGLFCVAVLSVAPTLNRFRGVCEHSFDRSIEENGYTRTHTGRGWADRLFYSLNFCYHFEHHLFPDVSSRHYPAIHEILCELDRKYAHSVSASYLATAARYLGLKSDARISYT